MMIAASAIYFKIIIFTYLKIEVTKAHILIRYSL